MNQNVKKLLAPLASLKLTVFLLALAMVLIFAGTTIQGEMGIWDVQRSYFYSWFTFIEWRLFFPLWKWGKQNIPGAIPFPGGYTIILLLLINLLAAHTTRFKLSWKRSGILLIHAGLILLILGEVFTSIFKTESQMTIDVGGNATYAEDTREVELVLTDPSPAEFDHEVVIPAGRLQQGATIQHPALPVAIRIEAFYLNSMIAGPMQTDVQGASLATAGAGKGMKLASLRKSNGTESKRDFPSGFITLVGNDGQSVGTYLVSTLPMGMGVDAPQPVTVGDKEYFVNLRFKREYKPYTIHLTKFSHDLYTGTDIPKNYSSLIRLTDPQRSVDREVLIKMNSPLRYNGETFYQVDFDHEADRYTVLQLVRNPAWLMPYVSGAIVAIGLLIHFGQVLIEFLRKQGKRATATIPQKGKSKAGSQPPRIRTPWMPAAAITGCALVFLVGVGWPRSEVSDGYAMGEFGRLPISYQGRIMPLDSLARNSLRIMSGKATFLDSQDQSRSADEFLASAFSSSMGGTEKAASMRIFRVDHPDLKTMLALDEQKKYYTFDEILAQREKLTAQIKQLQNVDPKQFDAYQRALAELIKHVNLMDLFAGRLDSLYLVPSSIDGGEDWKQLGQVVNEAGNSPEKLDPNARSLINILDSYANNQPASFNADVTGYMTNLRLHLPNTMEKMDIEVWSNQFEPFYQCMILYVGVFLLGLSSWLASGSGTLVGRALGRSALWLLILTLGVHTLGLVVRIYLQGRPPVTNLYSSAIFIAWTAAVFCVGLEFIYRNAVSTAVAALIAFPSLMIAHYLSLNPALTPNGDTMEMLQAVLDTNFWLATHVVAITMGYAATFLAGMLGICYVLRGVLLGPPDPNAYAGNVGAAVVFGDFLRHPLKTLARFVDPKTLARMLYGIVCFAMLFSFVGTVLGGIWADQSWGRFWGWDPKENGAVLIVLWNAIILHARWGGLVKDRGVAVLAIVGNVVTSWSWFGTNLLGIGLHSYGFMQGAADALEQFVALQAVLVLIGLLPLTMWRCFKSASALAPESTHREPANLAR